MVHPIVLEEDAINEQEYRINFLHSSLIGVFGGLWICIACRGEGWYLNGWATKFNYSSEKAALRAIPAAQIPWFNAPPI